METAHIQTVTIVGAGLIGGSFALALRHAGFKGRILGVSSHKTIEEAISLRVIDQGVSIEEGAAQGDLIYLAQPISKIIAQIPQVARHIRPGSLVTDAGSTKHQIVETASQCLPPEAFLGGHPMAGKESRGVASAGARLFEDRIYVLTPTIPEERFSPVAIEFVRWLHRIGAKVWYLTAETHDQVVSVTSHLAQLASTALGQAVLQTIPSVTYLPIAGPGLFDMTRLAMSSYDVWKDIIATNHGPITAALDRYIDLLKNLRDTLGTADTGQVFEEGCEMARRLRGGF